MNLVDSCGWVEYLVGGKNTAFFRPVVHDLENLLVPTICIFEVVKALIRARGEADAAQAAAEMSEGHVVGLDAELAVDAARLATELRLPLADSVILATARARGATVWTQDEHFEGIEGVEYRPAKA